LRFLSFMVQPVIAPLFRDPNTQLWLAVVERTQCLDVADCDSQQAHSIGLLQAVVQTPIEFHLCA
jgi:hypothetical protein